MTDTQKVWLMISLPIIVIILAILGFLFPSFGVFLLPIGVFLIIPLILLFVALSLKGSKVTRSTKKGEVESSTTSTTVVESTANTSGSWLSYLITFAIVLAVLGTAYYFLRDASWMPWAGAKRDVWYLSYSEPPAQRKGVKVFDEGFAKCVNLVDNATLFSMTCHGAYRTVDVFIWDKAQALGSWHRIGDKNTGGTFYLHKDPLGNYRGEAYASNKKTRAPILLYKCKGCFK